MEESWLKKNKCKSLITSTKPFACNWIKNKKHHYHQTNANIFFCGIDHYHGGQIDCPNHPNIHHSILRTLDFNLFMSEEYT
jgi:hypothetical protein